MATRLHRKVFVVIAAIILTILPGAAYADFPRVTAAAAVLLDVETGQIYFAKNHMVRREPASLTKIMTAVIALENSDLNDVVTVRGMAAAVSEGSIIELRKGEKITLGELLKAALVCSANDSTVAIAEHVGGSHDRFIAMMNKKAGVLGLFGTRFANTNGYHDPNHYTTAYDLAVLTRYALGNPKFNELVQTRETTVRWVEPAQREEKIANTNRLLTGGYEGVDGVKTGTTSMAGNCLIASSTRDGRRLIAVALHSDNRYQDCAKMFDYGFTVIRPLSIITSGQVVANPAVEGGVTPAVEAVAGEELQVRMDPDELSKLEKRLNINEPLAAPIKKGQKLGEVVYTYRSQELGRVNLVAGADVFRKGWHRQVWDKLFINH
ncbi:D-alanyl-D-alanine carboxypeptidase [Pelotomaculum terephthalicicum JT]|uniref:D-alanyl-D-alanine carboxypeptidase family protein n=1 Tax=Pelotomaculum TaxID=191373 RepID=UPI0009C9BE5C|nr:MULTISPECIES: D-alanyl-D-alanine carboxypeptidase family protein [Pelotomaculum]MCG9969374.1 D-alanyl-D-alanine carboxypeptidase [Pelotomaculum terephthalicicum JT]OPX87607.1 MAG: D-alanyl-D-alanine carboxypeptidase DacB precursor [Pelotomaculum sp. PtaB.Bin117]